MVFLVDDERQNAQELSQDDSEGVESNLHSRKVFGDNSAKCKYQDKLLPEIVCSTVDNVDRTWDIAWLGL
jgi:hypothetical protein